MGSKRAQIEKKVTELATKTKLSKQVVHNLVEQYITKCKDKRGLDRPSFRDNIMLNFHMLDDMILDRLFHTMDSGTSNQCLKVDDYVTGMTAFLTNNMEEKIKFCFGVYDLNADGYITRDEINHLLKNCMVTKTHDADQDDTDEGIKELTDITLKKLDQDHDGRVSMKDFRAAVHLDMLHLEALGQCLPDDKYRCEYLKMLGDPEMNEQPVTMSSAHRDRRNKFKK